MVEHLTFNQVVPGVRIPARSIVEQAELLLVLFFPKIVSLRSVAELADALVIGSSGHPVQVQVLSSADYEEALIFQGFFCMSGKKVLLSISEPWFCGYTWITLS